MQIETKILASQETREIRSESYFCFKIILIFTTPTLQILKYYKKLY